LYRIYQSCVLIIEKHLDTMKGRKRSSIFKFACLPTECQSYLLVISWPEIATFFERDGERHSTSLL